VLARPILGSAADSIPTPIFFVAFTAEPGEADEADEA